MADVMNRLHFKGRKPKSNVDKLVGPDMFGGWHRPVSQRYDIVADMTTVFYQPVPPNDLPEHMLAYSKRIAAQRKDPREWVREVVNVFCQDPKWQALLRPFLDSLRTGVRRNRAEPDACGLTKLQRESLKSLKRRGLTLPKHLERQA